MHILDRLGVVSQDTEIVNRVAIHGVTVDLLVVVKHAVSPKRTRSDNVAIRQDVTI